MNFTTLINSQIKNAFNLIGDLAVDITLTKITNSSFNFNTKVASSTPVVVTTKGILSNKAKVSEDKNSIRRELLVDTSIVGDITRYDKVTINSLEYTIGNILDETGFLSTVEISREA